MSPSRPAALQVGSAPSSRDAGHLWDRFHDELWGFLRARVNSDAACEDILQAAFLRAHTALSGGESLQQPRAWLYQIVRNLMNDAFRHQKRQGRLHEAAADESAAHVQGGQEVENPADEVLAFQAVAHVLPLFIDGLVEPYGEALRLTEIEGLTQSEAAERSGVSLTCMKSRVQRARKKVYDALMSCCTFEIDGRGRMISCQRRSPSGGCEACE